MEKIHYGYGMPTDLSTTGHSIDQLIYIVHYFMIALFVGWAIFMVVTLIRFRKREGHKASYQSTTTKVPKYIEIGIVLFEAFLLIGLSFPIWNYYKDEPPPKEEALTVRVVAQQFVWNFHYAGEDKKFGSTAIKYVSDYNPLGIDPNDPASADDFFTVNQFHFPVNKPIITQITSKDVIHSFGVPVLRLKQDAIPGMNVPIWFTAKSTGKFEIICSQLCGLSHYIMKGNITVDTEEDYEKWQKEQPRPFAKPEKSEEKKG